MVVRSREEECNLQLLIRLLRCQTLRDIEIILVVDYLKPKILPALKKLPVDRLIALNHDEFNHAYSTNLGVAASRGEFVAITNGHSLPISSKWLEAGVRHFSGERVAGVTGLSTPTVDGSVWEKLYFSPVYIELYRRRWLRHYVRMVVPSFFSTTNCMIRRSLWESYPFDESLPSCEDLDWGVEMQSRGYLTPIDPDFSVYHSHGDGLALFLDRLRRWRMLSRRITERTRPRSSYTRLSEQKSPALHN